MLFYITLHVFVIGRGCRRWNVSWKVYPSGFTWICRQNIRRKRLQQLRSSLAASIMKLLCLEAAAAQAVLQW